MSTSKIIHNFGEPHNDPTFSRRSRKRRYLSRSEEEIAEELDPKNLGYRAGWPDLPPLPLETDPVYNLSNSIGYREQIAKIFGQHGMPMDMNAVKFVFRYPKGTSPDLKVEFLTVLVERDFSYVSGKLNPAIVKTRKFLKDIPSLETSFVEVIDPRAITNLKSIHLSCKHPPCDELCRDVKEVLASEQGQPWLCLEILKRGFLDVDSFQPTIVITSATAEERSWWTVTLPAIKRMLTRKGYAFAVELLWARNLLLNGTDIQPAEIPMDQFEDPTTIGASIGLANDIRSAGTCGGQLILRKGTVVKNCGLTNWHVVTDDRLDALTKNGPLKPGDDKSKDGQRVMAPAPQDREGTIKKKEEDITTMQSIKGPPGQALQDAMTRADEDLKRMKAFDSRFGKVFAGSGKGIGTKTDPNGFEVKFPLDWALIDLSPTKRTIRTVVPSDPLGNLPARKRSKLKTGLEVGQAVNKWTKFEGCFFDDVDVAKYGRATQWTLGRVNPQPIHVNKVHDIGQSGRSWGISHHLRDENMVDGGDSGSVVLHDPSGVWLGLIWGETPAGEALFIPMDLIVENILKVTGAEMTSPVFLDPAACGLGKPRS